MSQNEMVEKNTPPKVDNTIWEYNGSQFELDLTDLEFAERYEKSLENLQEREKNRTKDGSMSARIREYDAMIRGLFDDIFGEGAGDAVLGEKISTKNCDTAFDALLEFVIKQQEENNRAAEALVSKYDKYQPNRAQRRAAGNVKKFKPAD